MPNTVKAPPAVDAQPDPPPANLSLILYGRGASGISALAYRINYHIVSIVVQYYYRKRV